MDTSKFKPLIIKIYREKDLKYILYCIHFCYLKILQSGIEINNDENYIRDLFISDEYLDNYLIKVELDITEFKFDKEIQTKTGRADIRVLNTIQMMKGISNPYYFIECKRIDDINPHYKDSLNNKYINNGINRFIKEKYPTYLEANAMLGFVVKNINIEENTKKISSLKHFKFIDNFEYSYISKHKTRSSNENITLYHLMLDFSSLIKFN